MLEQTVGCDGGGWKDGQTQVDVDEQPGLEACGAKTWLDQTAGDVLDAGGQSVTLIEVRSA